MVSNLRGLNHFFSVVRRTSTVWTQHVNYEYILLHIVCYIWHDYLNTDEATLRVIGKWLQKELNIWPQQKDNKTVCIFYKIYRDTLYLHHKFLSMQSLVVVAMVTTQK